MATRARDLGMLALQDITGTCVIEVFLYEINEFVGPAVVFTMASITLLTPCLTGVEPPPRINKRSYLGMATETF